MKLNLEASVETPIVFSHRNKPQIIKLIIKNKGFLPVSKAAALIVCSNAYTDRPLPITIEFPIPARNTSTVELTLTIPNCGLTEIRLKYLQFTDYIRLFSAKVHSPSSDSIMTLPMGFELGYKLNVPGSITDEESNIYSKLHAGDDPSEVYRIREYQSGDMPKRIHWKLSSRTDTVWVKEYSQPIKKKAAIIIDYSICNSITSELMDTALEAAYSLSMALIKQEIITTIYWLSYETENLVWKSVGSIDDLNSCFESMLMFPPASASGELLKQTSDLLAIHSTNAVYLCTTLSDSHEIVKFCNAFKNNQFYAITSNYLPSEVYVNENIISVSESSICEDLKKLSSMEVNLNE